MEIFISYIILQWIGLDLNWKSALVRNEKKWTRFSIFYNYSLVFHHLLWRVNLSIFRLFVCFYDQYSVYRMVLLILWAVNDFYLNCDCFFLLFSFISYIYLLHWMLDCSPMILNFLISLRPCLVTSK